MTHPNTGNLLNFAYNAFGGACGYRRRKWTRRTEFKSRTRLFAFHFALILLQEHPTSFICDSWRPPRCNGYLRRKWTRQTEFKSWTRQIAFHITLIPLQEHPPNKQAPGQFLFKRSSTGLNSPGERIVGSGLFREVLQLCKMHDDIRYATSGYFCIYYTRSVFFPVLSCIQYTIGFVMDPSELDYVVWQTRRW